MKCPDCGDKMTHIYNYHNEEGKRMAVYECLECGCKVEKESGLSKT